MMPRRVADLSHHNTVTSFQEAADAGLWGVIHKSSQGSGYRDPTYAGRRKPTLDAGLLWGAYHFNDGSAVSAQVDNFLKCAAPDDTTLMVLDYEDNAASNMTRDAAIEFMHLLEQKLGRQAAIYSGNRLKEQIGYLSATDRAYLTSRRLWLAQYGPKAVLPAGFKSWWLWQYTGDGVGPEPHEIAGISGTGIDLNVYSGETKEQLAKEWPGQSLTSNAKEPTMPDTPATTPAPIHHDVVPQIISGLEAAKTWVPRLVPNLPWWAQIALAVGVPIIEQGLNAYENSTTKSTPDIVHSVGGLIASVGQGMQTAVVAYKTPAPKVVDQTTVDGKING